MNHTFFFLLLLVSVHSYAQASETTTIAFANVDEGRKILATRDTFVKTLTPFDRSARLKTDQQISEQQYLDFVQKQVREWNKNERARILEAIEQIKTPLNELQLPLPKTIVIIKTSGQEEGGAAYTRANAIILPESKITEDLEGLKRLICHEIFHILSRRNPSLRDKLYANIGFHRCQEPQLPPDLLKKKLTNPDAPLNEHWIELMIDDKPTPMIPLLISRVEKYNVVQGGEFFQYLQLLFLAVEKSEASASVTPLIKDSKPLLAPLSQLTGFFEQVGRNTSYIIHPEEILADNFVHLVMKSPDIATPKVVLQMQETLRDYTGEKTDYEP